MISFFHKFIFLGLVLWHTVVFSAIDPTEAKLKMLYNSLDPTSISQHLAFYELYPHRLWGQQALKDAWQLLAETSEKQSIHFTNLPFSNKVIQTLVTMVNKPIDQELSLLDDEDLKTFQLLSSRLYHYSLKGHHVWTEREVLNLPLEEIDLARALFLSQLGTDQRRIQSYEALIDLMALQILARLPKQASPEDKIKAINTFVFEEMGFRFPPHSLYTKDIDLYTFLPSVLDSHRGVCLGVSILYLCLAQRLALSLEMITPPGHIYVRYCSGHKMINIETTARGIHVDSDEYLSVNTRSLQQRTIREVIGMAHFNQASVYWQQSNHEKALQAYEKAEPYMRGDPLLKELMAYTLILTGQKEKGERLLWEVKDIIPDYAVTKNTMCEDYLQGYVDADGIKTLFIHVDEDRASILAKKQDLEKILERYPRFRSGILSLAITWLQLHRVGEALETLSAYQALDNKDPEVHYYLSALYGQRHDYPKAWFHLQQAEAIVKTKNYDAKPLKELRRELLSCCPE